MNQQYDNNNRGVLFKNDKKEKDTHPDYKGTININGQEFWLSSWIKVSNAGSRFMSLSVTSKDAQQAPTPDKGRIAKAKPEADFPDEDLPF